MHVYYFRCYWSSNLVFVVRCVTYIPNLRKIRQKLRSLFWTIGISDRRTDRQTDKPSNQIKSNSLFSMAAISWIKICNNTTSIKLELKLYTSIRPTDEILIVQWLINMIIIAADADR